jgi:hypothetical protein
MSIMASAREWDFKGSPDPHENSWNDRVPRDRNAALICDSLNPKLDAQPQPGVDGTNDWRTGRLAMPSCAAREFYVPKAH